MSELFLNQYFSNSAPLLVPLALEPLAARVAANAGFQVGYVSGGALGYAYGISEALLTVTEIAEVTRRVTDFGEQKVIADVGVGFGDPVHVARTIVEMERAGAIAMEIEDQVAPKRVSHHRGIEHLVASDVMVDKIKVACDRRQDDRFAIIARTGAVKNESFQAALDRLHAYQDAGADILMLMPEDDSQIAATRSEFSCPLATIAPMDALARPRWQDSGWQVVIDPFTTQVVAIQAAETVYRSYSEQGTSGVDLRALMDKYHTLDDLSGLKSLYEIEDHTTESS